MQLYGAIDLHSNASHIGIVDEEGRVVRSRRVVNDLGEILEELEPYRESLDSVVVESTYNWYWLVDGLQETGYEAKLANPAAIQQYSGLKHADDDDDVRWLAEMSRLDILPTGYILPKQERAIRDLLRKRTRLVRQRTANLLSLQSALQRHLGKRYGTNELKLWRQDDVSSLGLAAEVALSLQSTVEVILVLGEQISRIEKSVLEQAKRHPVFHLLKTLPGVGDVLAWTILYETGPMERFRKVGNYASYCRCVSSCWRSNGKKKGQGNRKNGNPFLAWAFMEAANFAIRFNPRCRAFYRRKARKTNKIVARKALAHKLARASYYVMRDRVPFDGARAFGQVGQK
jgi:transposase